MRQRELEIRLARVPAHPDPSPGLEQYATPSPIAADLMYRALAAGHIQGRDVVDLGSGTGILAIGAALLGARRVVGVELDATAVRVAEAAARDQRVVVEFRHGPVDALEDRFDTTVMNPPFGAQFANRGADVRFLEVALRVADVSYSLHAASTRRHLLRLADRLGASPEVLTTYAFPLPHQFGFHRKEKVVIDVDLLRLQMG